jgi:hypothetical protein
MNIKSAPASTGRSRVGPALYVFSLLGSAGRCLISHFDPSLYTPPVGRGGGVGAGGVAEGAWLENVRTL